MKLPWYGNTRPDLGPHVSVVVAAVVPVHGGPVVAVAGKKKIRNADLMVPRCPKGKGLK